MKKLLYILAIILIVSACAGKGISDKLDQVDSLIIREQYDSAYTQLKKLENKSMSEEEYAYSYILLTQLGYLVNKPLSSDSLVVSKRVRTTRNI